MLSSAAMTASTTASKTALKTAGNPQNAENREGNAPAGLQMKKKEKALALKDTAHDKDKVTLVDLVESEKTDKKELKACDSKLVLKAEALDPPELDAFLSSGVHELDAFLSNLTNTAGHSTENWGAANALSLRFAEQLLATYGKEDPKFTDLMEAMMTAMKRKIESHRTAKEAHKLAIEARTAAIALADAKGVSVTAASNAVSLLNSVVSATFASYKTGLAVRAAEELKKVSAATESKAKEEAAEAAVKAADAAAVAAAEEAAAATAAAAAKWKAKKELEAKKTKMLEAQRLKREAMTAAYMAGIKALDEADEATREAESLP